MSSSYLQSQLSAFKSEASSSASKLSQKRTLPAQVISKPSPTPSTSSVTSKPELKRKRPEPTNVVYSQPADTSTGENIMTQVTYALEYLKSKDKAITFGDILSYLSLMHSDETWRRTLEQILKNHPKIEYDKAGLNGKGAFRFRPPHNVRSADELRAFLQRQPTAQGIHVKDLKDGWPGAFDAIAELEGKGQLLVTRNKKEQTPKMVWPNDPSLKYDVEPEFQNLWQKIRLPANSADLRKELVDSGLTPTSAVKAPVMKAKEKKKKVARKGGKTTNTHMANVLKDYSHFRRA